MSESHELPKPGFDQSQEAGSSVPAYRANLPSNLGDLADERESLIDERARTNSLANVFMVSGLLVGFGSFVLPVINVAANLGGPASLVGALNSFVGIVVTCIVGGVLLGVFAASIRSRVRQIDSRVRALDAHAKVLSSRQPE